MNYWHTQMQPDDKLSVQTLIDVIKTKNVIGLGETWNDKNGKPVSDPDVFKNEIDIGDIVMVRETITPIALVKVLGKAFIDKTADYSFDWFTLRRNVEVLSFFEENRDRKTLNRSLKKYGNEHIQAPGTLTKCQGNNATNYFIKQWHKQVMSDKLMGKIKISNQRKEELKTLWNKYKSEVSSKEIEFIENEYNSLLNDWKLYRNKITNNTLELDDYTNRINNPEATMAGGYLCNFLERTTKTVFGSSKPAGSALAFGVKKNEDGSYAIGKNIAKATFEEANTVFKQDINVLLESVVNCNEPLLIASQFEDSNYQAKQILRKLAVLDNLNDFIYIYSDPTIDALHNEFLDSETTSNLGKNYEIRKVLNEILNIENTSKENVLLSRFLWKYANTQALADSNTPNVILYGPPGTGKTYAVKNSLDFLCQGDRSRYEFVQFHPSFTYEDFIEGIKPKGVTENGNIKFELVDGIFKRFCKRAKNNLDKDYYFVVDEINRANLSSVFGETLLCIEKDYRHDGESAHNLIKTQYSSLIEDMIESNKDNVDLAYHLLKDEDGKVNAYFGVPKNVYFIGMMNDVDKSIDAFDLALRRRFKWIRKDCDYEVIENEVKFRNGEDFHNIEKYTKSCKNLNNFISEELAMGKSYEFGHSFFMKITGISNNRTITSKNLELLFVLHLKPTLKEYLRSMFAESQLDNKLEEALAVFLNPISR
ncbi:AAA family ATPase [uncultured Polaribacter sp.]|uniref:McrB family protein n=1 Tax=uncultured Polaribacter sp. TaxID=174711 RepID=UPI002617FA3B|nr:AAA family ATPase [uncultured Polaribacter sp.]